MTFVADGAARRDYSTRRIAAIRRAAAFVNALAVGAPDAYAELATGVVRQLDEGCRARLAAGRDDVFASVGPLREPFLSALRDVLPVLPPGLDVLADAELDDPIIRDSLFTQMMDRMRRDGDVLFVTDRQRARSRAFEVVHYLRNLRQRTPQQDRRGERPRLVEMMKVEVQPRQRPVRDRTIDELLAAADAVAELPPLEPFEAFPLGAAVTPLREAFGEFLSRAFAVDARFARFQVAAFEALLAAAVSSERPTTPADAGDAAMPEAHVIAAGTGFGKTEAFLFPLLYYAAFNKFRKARRRSDGEQSQVTGVDGLLLYPRTDLCDNQAERVLGYLFHLNAAVARAWDDQAFGPFDPVRVALAHSRITDAFRMRCPACLADKAAGAAAWTDDDERRSHIRARFDGPSGFFDRFECDRDPNGHRQTTDLLVYQVKAGSLQAELVVTTIDTLHRRLMDKHGKARIFGSRHAPPRIVVVDEMHIYEGQAGSHAAHILARCRQRVRRMTAASGLDPVLVGASATAGSPRSLGARMFGARNEGRVALIQPGTGPDETRPFGLEYYFFLQSPGNRVIGGAAGAGPGGPGGGGLPLTAGPDDNDDDVDNVADPASVPDDVAGAPTGTSGGSGGGITATVGPNGAAGGPLRFVAEQSTMIQAAFCLQHTMKAPAGDGRLKRRTLGFVDSVDVAQRLGANIEDAEWRDLRAAAADARATAPRAAVQLPLFALRYPAGRGDADLAAGIRSALRQFYGLPEARAAAIPLGYIQPPPAPAPGATPAAGAVPLAAAGCIRAETRDCHAPPHHLLERCDRYEAGECWFTMSHPREEGQRPVAAQVHRAGRRAWADPTRRFDREARDLWRLLVSTSALEVGFDDPELIATWQYHAPPSVASFVQRKGRGGRGARDYPITMLVLGASARDVYCFQDHLRLVDVVERDIATYLDPENPSVRDQHAVAAVFDYCAAQPGMDRAYEMDFDALLTALASRDAQRWVEQCFPTEQPRRLTDRMAELANLVTGVWNVPLDLTALPANQRPDPPLRPKDLFKMGRDEIVRLEWATRGVAETERAHGFFALHVAADEHDRRMANSVVDLPDYVPETLLAPHQRDLRVPKTTISIPLGRHVRVLEVAALPGGPEALLGSEPAEFALASFLPGGFKIRYDGKLWMAPWVHAAGAPVPALGGHLTWAATRGQLRLALSTASAAATGAGEDTAGALLASGDLGPRRRAEVLSALGGANCTIAVVAGLVVTSTGKRSRQFTLDPDDLVILPRRPDPVPPGKRYVTLARDPHVTPRIVLLPRRNPPAEVAGRVLPPVERVNFYRQFEFATAHYANLVHCYLTGAEARTVVVRFWDERAGRPMAPSVDSRSQAVEFVLSDAGSGAAYGYWTAAHAARAFWLRVEEEITEDLVVTQGLVPNAYLVPVMTDVLRMIEPVMGRFAARPPGPAVLRQFADGAVADRRLRHGHGRAVSLVRQLANELSAVLSRAAAWVADAGPRTVLADTLASVLSRVAGRALNVSPWSFRRLVDVNDDGARIMLMDDIEGGSGNARRLADEVGQWPDLPARVAAELDCPVARVDELVAEVLARGPAVADTLAAEAAADAWPAALIARAGDEAARLRQRLRRLLESPPIAAFHLYADSERRRLTAEFGGAPTALQLAARLRAAPAFDSRAEELRRRFLRADPDDGDVAELNSRARAVLPLCPAGCPSCVESERFDRRHYVDRDYLARAVAAW